MKIYTEYDTESDSVEILLDYKELKELTSTLVKFEQKVTEFLEKNKNQNNLGFTHVHFRDLGTKPSTSDPDIVIYVDLDKR